MSDKYTGRRIRTSSITTIVSISLVLFMLGLLGLAILNTQKLSNHVKENISFQIILNDNAKEAETDKLRKTLDAAPYVKSSDFIAKEEAARKLQEDLGEDFISFLGYNPLLASINAHLNASYANPDSLAWIEKELLGIKPVKEVIYQKSLVALVNENVNKISIVILGFSVLLMVIALALINNTIRLSIYSKRFLIKTMQLVGATRWFISKPFIFSGVRQGLYASMAAILLLIGVLYIAHSQMPELSDLQDANMVATLFGIVLMLGIVISCLSTWLAVRKYLSLNTEELYY